jgi:hypothetical protein
LPVGVARLDVELPFATVIVRVTLPVMLQVALDEVMVVLES